jgi:hypothetical protein
MQYQGGGIGWYGRHLAVMKLQVGTAHNELRRRGRFPQLFVNYSSTIRLLLLKIAAETERPLPAR